MAKKGEAATPEPGLLGLPDDVVRQILFHLPPAAVLRCRAVCKGLRGIIDGQGFFTAHRQRRAPKQPLFLYRRDFSFRPFNHDEDPGLVRVDLQAVDVAARECHQVLCFSDVPKPPEGPGHNALQDDCWLCGVLANDNADGLIKVEGSCDGILLISYLQRLYACNPCTGQWRSLPPIHQDGGIIGFYARASTGGGRAYRVLYRTGAPYISLSYRILELGADADADEPRDIARPLSPGMPQDLHDLVLIGGLPPAHLTPPITFEGNLHWPPLLPRTHMITVFDTAAEEFRWISSPGVPAGADDHHQFNFVWFQNGAFHLLEINDRLAMGVINAAGIHVWVLRDYANEAWEPAHQCELPAAAITDDIGYNPLEHPHPPAYIVSQGRDLLFRCPNAILHCNAAGDVVTQYWRPHHMTIATPHMFQESLVEHAFLPKKGSDGNDGEPPFLLPGETKGDVVVSKFQC